MAAPYLKGSARFYPVEGSDVDLPSVTTILSAIAKPALTNWAAKVERELMLRLAKETPVYTELERRVRETKLACNTRLTDAGDIGTAIHAWAEWETTRRIGGGVHGEPEPIVPPEGEFAKVAWLKWADEYKFEPLMTEQRIHSLKYGFAGTTDFVANVTTPAGEKRLVVGDYKSGSGIYQEHILQLAAYRAGLHEMGHYADEPTDGLVVKLPKKAKDTFKTALVTAEDLDEHFKTFLAVRDLWVAIKKFESDKRYR